MLLPLSKACGHVHGIDRSEGMLEVCHEKLVKSEIPPARASAELGDITNFELAQKFDLIIAPFRVFQNLELDESVDGLFHCVRNHLSPNGACILNSFMPDEPRDQMVNNWPCQEEVLAWETESEGLRLTRHDRRIRFDADNLVLHPEMIYRLYEGDTLLDETVFKAVLRFYYPENFLQLVEDHGFTVVDRWGGYAGEPWGQGPELGVRFMNRD